MKKPFALAALAIGLASGAIPAAAEQGTLDGVLYATPAGSSFLGPDWKPMQGSEMQARIDELRKRTEATRFTLFSTVPNTPDHAKSSPILDVIREASSPTEEFGFKSVPCNGIKPHADVSCLEVTDYVHEDFRASKPRGFEVRTGLPFAGAATAVCVSDPDERRCEIHAQRPNGIRMVWSGVGANDADASLVRDKVRELITTALPQEAARTER